MNKILAIVFLAPILVTSCSKKDGRNPVASSTNSVTINGKAYKTVIIGNQTWTSQNYDGPGGAANTYGEEADLGKFYSLSELKSISLTQGWRIPTKTDYMALFNSVGSVTTDGYGDVLLNDDDASRLRSFSYWSLPGNNQSGFNATGTGEYNFYQNVLEDNNIDTYFWTSTAGTNKVDTPSQCLVILVGDKNNTGGGQHVPISKAAINPNMGVLNYGFCIRFVKDN